MAARCLGFSMVLWWFWAAFVAPMRVRDCPETNAQANCWCCVPSLRSRGCQKTKRRFGQPLPSVCRYASPRPRSCQKKPHTSFLRPA